MRLLIFELHHLGDAVMALPFLRSAAERFEVTVVCRPPVARLLALIAPGMAAVEASETWAGRFTQSLISLRALKPDIAVCVWADARAALLMRACGARQRIGFPMTERNYYGSSLPWRRRNLAIGKAIEKWAAALGFRLLSHTLDRSSYTQSHVENWSQLARALDLAPNFTLPWFDPSPFPIPAAMQALRERHPGRRLWLLHPGARLDTKRWPMDHFESLLKTALAGEPVLIVKPPGEPFPQPQTASHVLFESEDLAQLIGALSGTDVVICNDSLAGHLAAALGRRVVTIFGSGNPDWFAPFGNADLAVSSPDCPYKPCIDRCQMERFVCLELLTPDDVAAKLPAP